MAGACLTSTWQLPFSLLWQRPRCLEPHICCFCVWFLFNIYAWKSAVSAWIFSLLLLHFHSIFVRCLRLKISCSGMNFQPFHYCIFIQYLGMKIGRFGTHFLPRLHCFLFIVRHENRPFQHAFSASITLSFHSMFRHENRPFRHAFSALFTLLFVRC